MGEIGIFHSPDGKIIMINFKVKPNLVTEQCSPFDGDRHSKDEFGRKKKEDKKEGKQTNSKTIYTKNGSDAVGQIGLTLDIKI